MSEYKIIFQVRMENVEKTKLFINKTLTENTVFSLPEISYRDDNKRALLKIPVDEDKVFLISNTIFSYVKENFRYFAVYRRGVVDDTNFPYQG